MQQAKGLEYGVVTAFTVDDKHPAGYGVIRILDPGGQLTEEDLFLCGAEEHRLRWSAIASSGGRLRPNGRPCFQPLVRSSAHRPLVVERTLVVFRRHLVGGRPRALPWARSTDVRLPVNELAAACAS